MQPDETTDSPVAGEREAQAAKTIPAWACPCGQGSASIFHDRLRMLEIRVKHLEQRLAPAVVDSVGAEGRTQP